MVLGGSQNAGPTGPKFGGSTTSGAAVWDLNKAYREATSTRERVCLNGLWRWQPAAPGADNPPTDAWGYSRCGKLPASRITCRRIRSASAHPDWKDQNLV
jgi:hypothetical protein